MWENVLASGSVGDPDRRQSVTQVMCDRQCCGGPKREVISPPPEENGVPKPRPAPHVCPRGREGLRGPVRFEPCFAKVRFRRRTPSTYDPIDLYFNLQNNKTALGRLVSSVDCCEFSAASLLIYVLSLHPAPTIISGLMSSHILLCFSVMQNLAKSIQNIN